MTFRTKNAVVTILFIILCTLFLSITRFTGFILYGTVLFMMIVYYFLIYWMLNFEVSPQGFISVLLLPVLFVGGYYLFYYHFLRDMNIYIAIGSTIVFAIFIYYFILTQNILNTSYFSNIGLTQAALVVNNFYAISTFFIVNLSIFLLPNVQLITKLIASVPVFFLIYLAFVLINNIEKLHLWFGVFFYSFFVLGLVLMYLMSFLNPLSALIIVIILSIVFRGVTVVTLYSTRKLITLVDFGQIFLESILIGFFIYLASI